MGWGWCWLAAPNSSKVLKKLRSCCVFRASKSCNSTINTYNWKLRKCKELSIILLLSLPCIMTGFSLFTIFAAVALCMRNASAFRAPLSSRCVISSRSQMTMEFDWKSFKKGNEERMGKSVDSKWSLRLFFGSFFYRTLWNPHQKCLCTNILSQTFRHKWIL